MCFYYVHIYPYKCNEPLGGIGFIWWVSHKRNSGMEYGVMVWILR